MSGLWEVFPKANLKGILRSGGCRSQSMKRRSTTPNPGPVDLSAQLRPGQAKVVSAEACAVGAAKGAECASAIDALIAQIERQGFVARSAGSPSTDNPFAEDAERASEEAASRIRGVLYAVWSRGWDKADRELAGGPLGE